MNRKNRGLSFLLVLIVGIFFAFSVQAAVEPPDMWITASETNGIPAQIDVFKAKTGGTTYSPTYTYQIYLPGNADPENCYLSWDGDLQATVDGETYSSGSCPIPPLNTEKTYTFRDGNQTTSLKMITYQGSSGVPAVFIDIDESGDNPTIAQMDGDSDHNITCTGRINIDGQWYEMPKIKGRGNATWDQSDDKKPYNVTLGSKINFPRYRFGKNQKMDVPRGGSRSQSALQPLRILFGP